MSYIKRRNEGKTYQDNEIQGEAPNKAGTTRHALIMSIFEILKVS